MIIMEHVQNDGLRERLARATRGLRQVIFYPFRPHIVDGREYGRDETVITGEGERFGALQRDWSHINRNASVAETPDVREDVL